MQDMFMDGLIPAFDMDTGKCKTCILTKITKKPFQNVKRKTKVLELVHSDLCDLHATPLLWNKKYFVVFIDDASRFCYVYLLHTKGEALDKFKVFKTKVELQQGSMIKRSRTDRGGEYMNTLYFQSVGIIHETTVPYTSQQNDKSKRKNRVVKEMVNYMLSYSGLSQGFWGEAMLTACYLLNRVPNKRNRITPYELWIKRKPNLNYLRVWGCRAVVRLPNPKLRTLVSINSTIESRDAIFDENRFSLVPRLSLRIPNRTKDIGGSVVPEEVTKEVVTQQPEPEFRKGKRNRTPKNFGPEFQLYLIEIVKISIYVQINNNKNHSHMERGTPSVRIAKRERGSRVLKIRYGGGKAISVRFSSDPFSMYHLIRYDVPHLVQCAPNYI
ncbi:zinc finger, CCHC-type containing protein [Tanacetum coccineum]